MVAEAKDGARAGSVRIDVWLWAARLYKTRTAAQAACTGGLVKLNDGPVKPSTKIKTGDRIRAQAPRGLAVLEVAGLGSKRLAPALARELYVDHSPPPPPREELPVRDRGTGRPTKQDRRAMDRLRRWIDE